MQRDPAEIAHRWLQQAAADLDAAERNIEMAIAYLACFLAQQSAEKALEALTYWTSGDRQRTHVIATLIAELPAKAAPPAPLAAAARTLDKYYTTTRYPDTLDYALPSESFSTEEARMAVRIAADVVEFARSALPPR